MFGDSIRTAKDHPTPELRELALLRRSKHSGKKGQFLIQGKRLSPHSGQVPFPCKLRVCLPRAFKGTLQFKQLGGSPSVSFPHSQQELSSAASCKICASSCIIQRWTSSSISIKVALGWAVRLSFTSVRIFSLFLSQASCSIASPTFSLHLVP